MAIIVVNEIPKPVKPVKTEPYDYRGKVRIDLEQAYNDHLSKFEFVGYKSNASAAQFAREEALKLFNTEVFKPAEKKVVEELKVKLKRKLGGATKYIRIAPRLNNAEPAIKISGVTVCGVKRLFGEIDWDYVANYESFIMDKYLKYYSDKDHIEELKNKYDREKFLEKARRGKK